MRKLQSGHPVIDVLFRKGSLMQIRSLFVVLACLFAVPALAQDKAIAWQGKGANGETIDFQPQALRRPAVLLFWATWCPYCKALMPYLQHVYDVAGKDKLDVYAIDFKDEDGDPAAELKERGNTFTLVREGDAIAAQYGVKGTPGLFLVDRSGTIIYKRSGGDAPEKVEAALREKLGLPPAQ
jgi:cytochrome c biogenesis protein CcmG/thiol:disulfide interchange protein DsbE